MADKIARTGVSFDPYLLKKFDEYIKAKGYKKRSEAISDIVREKVFKSEEKQVFAVIRILYDPREGHFNVNLTKFQHEYNCLILSTNRVYLDYHTCLEIMVVKESREKLKRIFEKLKKLNVKDAKMEIVW